jgi:hypothetical protein
MSWVNDPHSDLTALPVLEGQGQEEEEIPDPSSEFWDEAYKVHQGITADYHQQIIIPKRVCVFGDDGSHISMAENCPHYNTSDEEGPRINPGWTVQQNRR